MRIQAVPAEKYFCLKKRYRFDREKTQKTTETIRTTIKVYRTVGEGGYGCHVVIEG